MCTSPLFLAFSVWLCFPERVKLICRKEHSTKRRSDCTLMPGVESSPFFRCLLNHLQAPSDLPGVETASHARILLREQDPTWEPISVFQGGSQNPTAAFQIGFLAFANPSVRIDARLEPGGHLPQRQGRGDVHLYSQDQQVHHDHNPEANCK